MRVRARITDPAPGSTFAAGTYTVRGKAWSGTGPVTKVEISLAGEGEWHPAQVDPPKGPYQWQDWSFDWEATRSDGTAYAPAQPTLPGTSNQMSHPGTGWVTETTRRRWCT
jgi:hypothetical protein